MLSGPRISLAGGVITAVMAVVLSGATPASATTGSSPYFTTLSNPMVTPLTDAAVAPLPDGQVLIAGGFEGGSPQENAELFNPVDDTFTALSTNLGGDRQAPAAAPLPDGQVLIAGGNSGVNSGYLQSAVVFNPATGTFNALMGGLQTARSYAAAAPLPTGEVLIAGGVNSGGVLQSAELFNPATNTFTALTASGDTELTTPREDPAAVALPDGEVLIAGGYNGTNYLQSAELFNPTTNTFAALPASGSTELQTAREGAVAVLLPDGQVLIAGGYNGGPNALQSAELFNPANNTFTPLPASGNTELGTMRKSAMAAALPNGQVVIAGGFTGGFAAQTAELYVSAPEVAAAGGDFGDQTVGEPSPVSVIVVTNVGAQALSISGASIAASADSADFAITANACLGRTLAFEQSCTITARFTPTTAATGLTATIALTDNEPTASTITLTGNGVAANSGPPGTNGTNGTNGSKGATGATGPRGPAGEVELVTCKSVTTGKGKHKKTSQKCTTKLTSSPVTFKTTGDVITAVLSRRDVVYATGSAIRSGKRTKLLLTALHQIRKGSYTLTLTHGRQRQRETITIA